MYNHRWLRFTCLALLVVVTGSFAFSFSLQSGVARRFLIARLEASFGRRVEVARFGFSLWQGARLQANSLSVAENPDFGHEYFLRAENLSAGLRWTALLAGRFEFDNLSVSRASLNLVRNPDGRWNLESWLPPVAGVRDSRGVRPVPAERGLPSARLYRIDVDGGRINFKQGSEKSGFALLEVSGRVDQDRPGRWRLDLQATPLRAGVELQQVGELRLRGTVGGTTARLQPAVLTLTWRDVSLADALRLSRGFDSGVRGELAVDLNATIAPPPVPTAAPTSTPGHEGLPRAQWTISAAARLTGIHGWQLPPRDSDPGVNLSAHAFWQPGQSHLAIDNLVMEMASSHLQGSGELDWGEKFSPQVHIQSSVLGLADILAWYRAFRPEIPENVALQGTLGVDATLASWPLRLEQGALASTGARLSVPGLVEPLHTGPINASVLRGGLDFAPSEIFFPPGASGSAATASGGAAANSFLVRGTVLPSGADLFHWPFDWTVSVDGGTSRIQDWLALSQAIGHPLARGWTAAGSLSARLRGEHHASQELTHWLGSAEMRNMTVSAAFLNQPLRLPRTQIEMTPTQHKVTLSAAEAFGTTWQGTMTRASAGGGWTFDLAADRLDAAEINRWLVPGERPGLLARLARLRTGNSANQAENAAIEERDAAIAGIKARGRIRLAQFILAPLKLEHVDGQAGLAGRAITVTAARAELAGGRMSGKFSAELTAVPSYRFEGRFVGVDLVRLAQDVAPLKNRVPGKASLELSLAARGIGREALVSSMAGEGKLESFRGELRGFDAAASGPKQTAVSLPGAGRSVVARGEFRIAERKIAATALTLDYAAQRFEGAGSIDFSLALSLKIRRTTPPASDELSLEGTVEAPRLLLTAPPSVIAEPSPAREAESMSGRR